MTSHPPQKAEPQSPALPPPFRLRLLGGLELVRTDGKEPGPAARQRRLLALLAILGAAGPQGISRDKVLLLLWPDRDSDKARHALTQSLYHARRTLGVDDPFIVGGDLRLNPERISCDLTDLELALREKRWHDAAGLYAGPFLADFAVTGLGEFERWQSAHRDRLERHMAQAYGALAAEAHASGDLARVVAWRASALALDPLGTESAELLIRAMVAAGDRVGALREALAHEARVRTELEVEPDAAFRRMVEDLREGRIEVRDRVMEPLVTTAAVSAPLVQLRRQRRVLAVGAFAALVVLMAVGLLWTFRSTGPELGQRILVAPFRVTGAGQELAFLREGMVELLSTRLGDQGAPQAVDAGAVINVWRGAGILDGNAERERLLRVARKLGAQSIVHGAVVGSRQHLVVSATLIAATGEKRERVIRVAGPGDSLTALVDELASQLLITEADEDERFASRTTPSVNALLAYLDAQALYRRGDYSRAVPLYERALAFDSTFALAALQLALAADRLNALEQHDRALAIAWRYRAELSDRDRSHLEAFAGPRYPQPSSEAEQLAAWERAAALAPDRADTWVELGERFLRSGRLLSVQAHEQRATRALARALELNPDDRVAQRYVALLAARRQESPRLGALLAVSPSSDDDALRIAALVSQYDAAAIENGERAVRLWHGRARQPGKRLDALLAMHSQALNQGRPVLALDVTEQIEEQSPGSQAHLRLRVLDALYGDGDSSAARAAALELAESVRRPPSGGWGRALQLANLCVLAQWQLERGALDAAKAAVARLRASGMPAVPVIVGANPHTCAELLDAALVVRVSAEAGRRSLLRLDSLMLAGPSAGDASAYAHIWIARMWRAVGDDQRAAEAIRRRPYLAGWPRYLATTRREEGRLAAALGDRARAARSFREYLAWRTVPEPTLRPTVQSVRAAESALH